MPEMWDDEMLQKLHHVLLEVSRRGNEALQELPLGFTEAAYWTAPANAQLHVEEGKMTCRNCGHIYPIQNGIPNMVSWSNRALN